MRSFSLFTLAAAALFPFVSAAPLANADPVLAARTDILADAKANTQVSAAVTGVVSILADLQVNIADSLCDLHYLTLTNATSANITPALKSMVSVIANAVVDLNELKGKPASTIMASVDGTTTVDVTVVAQSLASILGSIFLALSVVLSVVSNPIVLVNIVANVALGGCLVSLVNAVSALASGLLAELTPLVKDLASVLITVGLTSFGSLLKIC